MQSVILLPGLACDAMLWRAQLPGLATRHRVHVTDVHFRFDSLQQMAAALLDECPGRHVLIGHSMGGMLAMAAAAQAPDRVAALALLGTTARPDTEALMRLRQDAIVLFEQGRIDDVLRANLLFALHPRSADNPALVRTYLDDIKRAGAAALIRQNRVVMARPDARTLLPALRCPTLVACGDADLATPPECSREIAALVPGSRLTLLPDCGHMLTMEQPERVTDMLLDWLAALD